MEDSGTARRVRNVGNSRWILSRSRGYNVRLSVSRDRSDRMVAPRIEEGSSDGVLNVRVAKCYSKMIVVQDNLSLRYF